MKKPKAIIFDIDGTLAQMGDRSPYHWAKVDIDKPKKATINVLKLYKSAGYKIIIFTGRDASCTELTQAWLRDHGVEWDYFDIRPAGSSEKDAIIKKRMYERMADKFEVEAVYDDRDQVVAMWRDIGLQCFQVDYGDF